MKDSYAGNDEVAALRTQITALTASGTLPADLAAQVTALEAKLGTVGSAAGRGARGGGGRGGNAATPGEATPVQRGGT